MTADDIEGTGTPGDPWQPDHASRDQLVRGIPRPGRRPGSAGGPGRQDPAAVPPVLHRGPAPHAGRARRLDAARQRRRAEAGCSRGRSRPGAARTRTRSAAGTGSRRACVAGSAVTSHPCWRPSAWPRSSTARGTTGSGRSERATKTVGARHLGTRRRPRTRPAAANPKRMLPRPTAALSVRAWPPSTHRGRSGRLAWSAPAATSPTSTRKRAPPRRRDSWTRSGWKWGNTSPRRPVDSRPPSPQAPLPGKRRASSRRLGPHRPCADQRLRRRFRVGPVSGETRSRCPSGRSLQRLPTWFGVWLSHGLRPRRAPPVRVWLKRGLPCSP